MLPFDVMLMIELIVTIVYSVFLMYLLLDFDFERKKGQWFMGILLVILLLCGGFFWFSAGFEGFMIFYPIFVHAPLFILFWFVSKYRGIRLIFVLLTVIFLSSPPLLLGHIVASFFQYSPLVLNLVCFAMYLPMSWVVYRYIRPSFLYMLRNVDSGWAVFCIIPLSYNLYTLLTGKYDISLVRDASLLWVDACIATLAIVAYILILRIFAQTREKLVLEHEQNLLAVQVSGLKERYETLREAEENMKIFRHDFRHHVNLIQGYLANQDWEKATDYISKIENRIEETISTKYCNNETVNIIISPYIKRAINEKIAVKFQGTIPQNCIIEDIDLCIMLSNAIENAIHASMASTLPQSRWINISCMSKKGKLLIEVTNNFVGEINFIDGVPVSTKENHGFGTKSILVIVQKYGGLCSFGASDGIFVLRIII